MKRPSFAYGKSPMIVAVIKEKTAYAAICKIREAEFAGARGIDLHLPYLRPEDRTIGGLKKIISSTNRPILALNYDTANYTDEERMESLVMAAEAGAAAVDVQGYTFDRASKDAFVDDNLIPEGMEFLKDVRPKEISLKPEVIEKQRAFVDKIHGMGAEVLGSIHFGTVLTKEQLEKVARFARSKGFDIVKMVATCTDRCQVPDAIAATIHLNETLDFPFSYHMNGKEGIITRKLCPLFGSHVMFCNVSYDSEGADPEQLHVRAMVDAYRALGEL